MWEKGMFEDAFPPYKPEASRLFAWASDMWVLQSQDIEGNQAEV